MLPGVISVSSIFRKYISCFKDPVFLVSLYMLRKYTAWCDFRILYPAWILEPWRLVGLLAGCLAGLDWIGFEWLADGRHWWDGKMLQHARRSERSADIDGSGLSQRLTPVFRFVNLLIGFK